MLKTVFSRVFLPVRYRVNTVANGSLRPIDDKPKRSEQPFWASNSPAAKVGGFQTASGSSYILPLNA